ncbi:MAG: hypothetical protein U5K84_12195 [Alkalibacterium sp.]|nr:hypothetical protein [Alkalibacterium sp.]
MPKESTQGPWEVYGEDELGQLAALMRIDLSDDVADAQESIDAERRRLDSVLTHMTDGVVATGQARMGGAIINEMAQSMLDEGTEMKQLEKICCPSWMWKKTLRCAVFWKNRMMSWSTAHKTVCRSCCVLHCSTGSERIRLIISGNPSVYTAMTSPNRNCIEEEIAKTASCQTSRMNSGAPRADVETSYIEAIWQTRAWQDPDLGVTRFLEVTPNADRTAWCG